MYFLKNLIMHVHQGMQSIKEKTENLLYKFLRSQMSQLMPLDESMRRKGYKQGVKMTMYQ